MSPWFALVEASLVFLIISGCRGQKLTLQLRKGEEKTGIDLGFDPTESRSISLAPGETYSVACSVGNVGDFDDTPWIRDSIGLSEMNHDDASNSTQVFYENDDLTNKKVLYLWNFNSSLVGNYTCRSTEDTKTLLITANDPSVVIDQVYSERVSGSSQAIIISATVFGDPSTPQDTTWYYEGSVLDNSLSGITFSQFGKTTIISFPSGAKRNHLGRYTLTATTPAGTSNDSFYLQIFTVPVIKFTSDCNCLVDGQIGVPMNSSFSLSCIENSSIPLPVFTWFRGGTRDPEDLVIGDNHVTIVPVSSTESRLVFKNISLDYAGEYFCKANNTKKKDVKSVTINVNHPPRVTAISSSTINVPIGNDLHILVKNDGGFPAPSINWTHNDGMQSRSVSENSRAFVMGNPAINVTIMDTVVGDGGTYILTLDNGVGAISLEFTVNIQVPPTLDPISNYSSSYPVNGMATFTVGVSGAQPPVESSNLVWSGNFDSSRRVTTFKDKEAILELSDLKVSDTGDVLLTVNHPAKTLTVMFNLTVLDVPDAPLSSNVVRFGMCHIQVKWDINDSPGPTTAPADEVLLERRACLHNDTSCGKDWEALTTHPSELKSCNVTLQPGGEYSFRLTSCNDDFGCSSPEVVPVSVQSHVTGFDPKVSSLVITSVNSSSIEVVWAKPRQTSDCYTLSRYIITCFESTKRIFVRSVDSDQPTAMLITDLTADTRYNCSVSLSYVDLFQIKAQLDHLQPSYAANVTYPKTADIREFDIPVDKNDQGTAVLDLKSLGNLLTEEDFSYLHVAVLRLGNSPTVSSESPDELYPSINSFSDYDSVHSENGKISYRPYIAAEISIDDIPGTFVLGSGNVDDRKRQTYINGPLVPDDFYSAFIRVYANSKFGRQLNAFTSSRFTEPFQSEGSDPTSEESDSGSNSGAVAAAVVVVVLVIIVVVVVVVVVLFGIHLHKSRRHKRQTGTNGTQNMIPLNDYSDLDEVKARGLSKSPPPEPPTSSPPKKKPLHFTNPGLSDSPEPKDNSLADEGSIEKASSVSVRMGSTSSSRAQTPRHSGRYTRSPTPIEGGKRSPGTPVNLDDFQDHLNRLDNDKQLLFEKEFTSIQVHSVEHGAEASSRAHMHGKNRYKNITAFDHTRVVLSEIEGLLNSDYINANYIKGYDDNKLYIATQGPTEETHVDFWRMIWEQRTTTIVMLTNLEEKGKPKCYHYWPTTGGKAYGDIVVRVDRDIILPFYTIRSFKLIDASRSDGERTVIQFHYTAWPDKNVPAQASPVLDFLRALNTANNSTTHGPIVVHCSAGVGRTGTIIALDICLDQLKTEGRVDVKGVVSFLREQRTQMVQTQSQYIFIHHAILENIVYGDTTVLLKNFPEKHLKLQANHCALIQTEYDTIGTVSPPAQASTGPCIVHIRNSGDEEASENKSFPAFVVDGYWYQNLFLTCSNPTNDNQELFWHLVWQEGCSHIINVSQKAHNLYGYFPDTGESKKHGELEIVVDRMEYKTGYILRTITISSDSCKETLSVKHMQYEDWLAKQMPRTEKFVKFLLECIRETHTLERDGHPILVHDNGSMAQLGVFITLLNCFERIKKERLVDLLQTVNRLHLQCPQAVASMDKNLYGYCYDCLHEYCGKLQRETSEPPIYENIASIRGRLQPSPEPVSLTPVSEVEGVNLNEYEILDNFVLSTPPPSQ